MGCTAGCMTRELMSKLSNSIDFKGKVAMVTEASTDIGAAVAFKLIDHGADLVLVSKTEAKLNEVATECANHGKIPLVLVGELINTFDVNRILDETINKYGKLDIIVNINITLSTYSMKTEYIMKDFDEVFYRNLLTVVLLSHKAVPYLAKTNGNILNVSICNMPYSPKAGKSLSSWTSAKATVNNFSRCIAADLAPKGIRVNTLNTGPIKTDFASNDIKKYEQKNIDELLLESKIVAEAKDLADIITFLASDKAKGVTGSVLSLDI